MIYPKQFESKIGFDKIKALLASYCISNMGHEWVDKLKFSAHFMHIQQWLQQTEEMKMLLLSGTPLPAADFFDLRKALQGAKKEGQHLQQAEAHDLGIVLHIMQQIKDTLEQLSADYPVLWQLLADWDIFPHIRQAIAHIIDDHGHIRDHASEALQAIRQKLRHHYANNENHLQQHLQEAIRQGWTSADSQISIRDGRLVIPLHAQYKRQIKGFTHAASASGQTVFVEPQELFQINNEIVELEAEEQREILRILLRFTDEIRSEIPLIINSFHTLGMVDFMMAKARLAIDIEAVKPDLQDHSIIEWKGARHPLLFLSHLPQGKTVVPLDIALKKDKRILIISGPNAGGKSVALKTVGLLQYMLQCGLLVPMKPTSLAGIFKHFFIDIGDEQSIENDLSTYSSHLFNMKYFLRHANQRSLFLIDEMGGGTDPHMGGAIAEAVLEQLAQKGSYGLVTTHFSNLKLMAAPDNSIENGAMLFNTKALEPLYVLQTGHPGSSFTYEIAKKIGFPSHIIEALSGKINHQQLDFEAQLQQLDVEKKALAQQKKNIDASDKLLSDTLEKYQSLYSRLQADKQNIIRDAKAEAEQILASSNKLIENTIHEIKKAEAEKERTKQARKKIQDAISTFGQSKAPDHQKEVAHKLAHKQLKKPKPSQAPGSKPPKEGDRVKIAGQNGTAILESLNGKEATVLLGSMRMRIAYHKLSKVGGKAPQLAQQQSTFSHLADEINEKTLRFNAKIDLRGERLEDALEKVRNFVDEAIMLRMHEVQILHGKGSGILRDHIRRYLKSVPEVITCHDEHIDRGGHGITIVVFDL